jgi:adenylate cyclase class 2
MRRVNFEFKARLRNERRVRAVLAQWGARQAGTDHQVDTYFRVPRGRLKIREGDLENGLIYYRRSNQTRPRPSDVEMVPLAKNHALRAILTKVFEPWVVVEKQREIYFVGNVKIHLDRLKGLGKFVEVEAISSGRSRDLQKARRQAATFRKLFGLSASDSVGESYSDLVLRKSNPRRSMGRILQKTAPRRRPTAIFAP